MTVKEFIKWFYDAAEYLNNRKEMIGVTSATAHFAGEEIEMPGPSLVLVMDFPEQQTVQAMLHGPMPNDIEVSMIVYAGGKATTRDAAEEGLEILQRAAMLLRQGYQGVLTPTDSPLAFINTSPDMFTVGAIYNVKFKLI